MKKKSESLCIISQNSEQGQGYYLLNFIQHPNPFKNVPDISSLMYNTFENGNAIFHGEE